MGREERAVAVVESRGLFPSLSASLRSLLAGGSSVFIIKDRN